MPFWDSQDEFGDTNLLVRKPEEGASLARALGDHNMVLMRRHGATVVGSNLRQLVFRTIYGCRNAEYQTQAKLVGRIGMLTPGEIDMAGDAAATTQHRGAGVGILGDAARQTRRAAAARAFGTGPQRRGCPQGGGENPQKGKATMRTTLTRLDWRSRYVQRSRCRPPRKTR